MKKKTKKKSESPQLEFLRKKREEAWDNARRDEWNPKYRKDDK